MIKEEATILLTTLRCIDEGSDAARDDEMYILISVDGAPQSRHPAKADTGFHMNTGDVAYVDIEIPVSYMTSISVDLYENDNHNSDDHIGGTQKIDRFTYRDENNEGALEFIGSTSHYFLDFRVLTDPIPTMRLHGIRCEQTTAGMNVGLVESIAGAAQSCMEAAAAVLEMSPRPKSQVMAEAFEAASVALGMKVNIAEWKANIRELRDDIYMRHVDDDETRGFEGAFFPPGTEDVYKMNEGTELYFEDPNCYGKYFRFPLDRGPVAIELRERDLGGEVMHYDVIAGALVVDPEQIAKNTTEGIDGGSPDMTAPADGETEVPSSIEGGSAIFDGDAVVEIANSYYGRHNGEGAAYFLCYSVGMEDWTLPATSIGQEIDPNAKSEGTVSAGNKIDLDGHLSPENYSLPEGKTAEDIVAIAIDGSNICYTWFKDQTACSGTPYELDKYTSGEHYTLPSGKTPNDIVGIGITDGICYSWFKISDTEGYIECWRGHTLDLSDIGKKGNCRLPKYKVAADVVEAGISLSSDHCVYWYKDGQVTSGTSTYTAEYDDYKDYTLAPGKTVADIVAIGIGPGDRCYVWYRKD